MKRLFPVFATKPLRSVEALLETVDDVRAETRLDRGQGDAGLLVPTVDRPEAVAARPDPAASLRELRHGEEPPGAALPAER